MQPACRWHNIYLRSSMSLEQYRNKRSFSKTPEPTGGVADNQQLHFVVQKHHASHLHYDFRLEVKGVLKSWAVPKGPSLNPEDHRLAMATEDHPYDYKNFEGIIPKGQYGGGTVIIWDEGFFDTPVVREKDKKAQEHSLTQQYYKGEMLFTLHGHKLKGRFALIKNKAKGETAWYLLKVKDKYASKSDVTRNDKSVISGLTIEEMQGSAGANTWYSNRTSLDAGLLKRGKKAVMPARAEAMNATLIKEPFNDPGWVYEVKWDGYRILATKKGSTVRLLTRGGLDYSKYYPVLVEAIKELPHDCILDGEVVVLDEDGKPNFDLLQKYTEAMRLVYYGFDLLWVDGYDVTSLDLDNRKQLLFELLPEGHPVLQYSEEFPNGDELFRMAVTLGLEGIVAKRKTSKYKPGIRTKDWLKLPTTVRQEFVIGGWTESESGRQFRSLLFGAYDDEGKFKFVGHSGSGFKDKVMQELIDKLKPLETKKKPFVNEVDHSTKPHWVKPELVGNFKFATWTSGGKIRKPAIFLGLRADKDPNEVVFEVPLSKQEEDKIVHKQATNKQPVTKPPGKTTPKSPGSSQLITAPDSNWPDIDSIPVEEQAVITIDGKDVELTNVNRQVFNNVRKGDLITYYNKISPYILPYLKDRPLSLYIKHIHANAKGLYIKDMEGRQPSWAEIFTTGRKHRKKGKRDVIDYLVCNDLATLIYVINLGCIDINPWTSRTTDYLHPDYVIIDLDPSDEDFNKAIETARAAKAYFDKLKIKAFPKTSGKTGMHLYLPCDGFTFPRARKIAERICHDIHEMVPGITTTNISVNSRGNKLYVDPNQNDEADTVAAPYSVRPSHQPSVSTPLEWKEIKNGLDSRSFDIKTIFKRLEKKGDLFAGVNDNKIATQNSAKLRGFL